MTSIAQVLIKVILGIQGFFLARPGLPAKILAAAARLDGVVDTIRTLGQVQDASEVRSKKAVEQAEQIRRYIWFFIVQPFSSIAGAAFAGDPARKAEFRMTNPLNMSKERFLARGRSIIEAIRANEAVLLEFGMDPGLPALLEAKLNEYMALPVEVTEGRRTRSNATDGLDKATRQALRTIRWLDGLVRHHFRDDPTTLAEWATVRNIPWPGSTAEGKRARKAKADADAQASLADDTIPPTGTSN